MKQVQLEKLNKILNIFFVLDAWSRRTPATNRRCLQKQVLGLFFPIDFVEKQPDAAFSFRHVHCVLSVCTALKDMHVFM